MDRRGEEVMFPGFRGVGGCAARIERPSGRTSKRTPVMTCPALLQNRARWADPVHVGSALRGVLFAPENSTDVPASSPTTQASWPG